MTPKKVDVISAETEKSFKGLIAKINNKGPHPFCLFEIRKGREKLICVAKLSWIKAWTALTGIPVAVNIKGEKFYFSKKFEEVEKTLIGELHILGQNSQRNTVSDRANLFKIGKIYFFYYHDEFNYNYKVIFLKRKLAKKLLYTPLYSKHQIMIDGQQKKISLTKKWVKMRQEETANA